MKTNETKTNKNVVELQFCRYDEKNNCEYIDFKIPKLWLLEYLDLSPNQLKEFLNEYTSEDAEPIYSSAFLQDVLIEAKHNDSIYHKEPDSICYSLKKGYEEFEVKIKVSAEFLEDVVVTAFETGTNYWCVVDDSTPIWNKYYGVDLPFSQCLFELLYNGEEIELFDIENHNTRWFLTWEKLLQGITIYNSCYNSDVLDSIQADNIIQCALFGKVVFS